MECLDCGHTPQCSQCDVTLTYHQPSNQLKCHYCGFTIAAPTQCHGCGGIHLQTKGVGTQQIQEQVESFFPGVKTARMDWDTTRGKWAFDKLINAFVEGDIKILVGTQMVVKGLDFQKIVLKPQSLGLPLSPFLGITNQKRIGPFSREHGRFFTFLYYN